VSNMGVVFVEVIMLMMLSPVCTVLTNTRIILSMQLPDSFMEL